MKDLTHKFHGGLESEIPEEKRENAYSPATKDLKRACENLMKLGNIDVKPAFKMLKSPLVNFGQLETKDQTHNGKEYLTLLMKYGNGVHNGFLYGTLLIFVNMLIKETRKLGQKNKEKSLRTKAFLEIEGIINGVLKRNSSNNIKPPFENPKKLDFYDREQQLYPQTVVNFLIEKKYLNSDSKEALGAYWKYQIGGETKTSWVYVTLDPIVKGQVPTISYFQDETKKILVCKAALENVVDVLSEGNIDLAKYGSRIEEIPVELEVYVTPNGQTDSIKLFAIPKEGQNGTFTTNLRGADIDLILTDPGNFRNSSIIPKVMDEKIASTLSKIRARVSKCKLVIQGLDADINGSLNSSGGLYSKLLRRDLFETFRYTFAVKGHEATIFARSAQKIVLSIPKDGRSIENLGISQIYVKKKNAEPEKLYDMYHRVRHEAIRRFTGSREIRNK